MTSKSKRIIPCVVYKDVTYAVGDCVYVEPSADFEFEMEAAMRKKQERLQSEWNLTKPKKIGVTSEDENAEEQSESEEDEPEGRSNTDRIAFRTRRRNKQGGEAQKPKVEGEANGNHIVEDSQQKKVEGEANGNHVAEDAKPTKVDDDEASTDEPQMPQKRRKRRSVMEDDLSELDEDFQREKKGEEIANSEQVPKQEKVEEQKPVTTQVTPKKRGRPRKRSVEKGATSALKQQKSNDLCNFYVEIDLLDDDAPPTIRQVKKIQNVEEKPPLTTTTTTTTIEPVLESSTPKPEPESATTDPALTEPEPTQTAEEPTTEPASQPVSEATTEPTAELTTEPATAPTATEPVPEPTTEPAAELTTEPISVPTGTVPTSTSTATATGTEQVVPTSEAGNSAAQHTTENGGAHETADKDALMEEESDAGYFFDERFLGDFMEDIPNETENMDATTTNFDDMVMDAVEKDKPEERLSTNGSTSESVREIVGELVTTALNTSISSSNGNGESSGTRSEEAKVKVEEKPNGVGGTQTAEAEDTEPEPEKKLKGLWLARIVSMWQEGKQNYFLAQWFEWPERTILKSNCGLHKREVFLSKHKNVNPMEALRGKCEIKHVSQIIEQKAWLAASSDRYFYKMTCRPETMVFKDPSYKEIVLQNRHVIQSEFVVGNSCDLQVETEDDTREEDSDEEEMKERYPIKFPVSATGRPRVKCLELFSGAGGLNAGLLDAGIEVKWAVEMDRNAVRTHRKWHPRTYVFEESVQDLLARLIIHHEIPFKRSYKISDDVVPLEAEEWHAAEWEANESFDVEAVLAEKKSNTGEQMYYISWAGWGQEHNQWFFAKDLECNDLIRQFWEKRDKTNGNRTKKKGKSKRGRKKSQNGNATTADTTSGNQNEDTGEGLEDEKSNSSGETNTTTQQDILESTMEGDGIQATQTSQTEQPQRIILPEEYYDLTNGEYKKEKGAVNEGKAEANEEDEEEEEEIVEKRQTRARKLPEGSYKEVNENGEKEKTVEKRQTRARKSSEGAGGRKRTRDNEEKVFDNEFMDSESDDDEVLRSKAHKLPKPGDVDMITGGPPCQGFSSANGFAEWRNPLRHQKNKCVLVYLDFIDYYRPKYFIFENVLGILEAEGMVPNLIRIFVSLGYQVRPTILKAAYYGAPQNRHRVVILGALQGYPLPARPVPTHHFSGFTNIRNVAYSNILVTPTDSDNLKPPVTVLDAIGDLPVLERDRNGDYVTATQPPTYRYPPFSDYQREMRQGAPQLMNHYSMAKNDANYNFIARIPKQPDVLANGTLSTKHGKIGAGGEYRLEWHKCFNTIVCVKSIKRDKIVHPCQHRIMSVRESARAQGVPDKVRVYGGLTSGYRQLGNMVPVQLSHAIGLAFMRAIVGRPLDQHERELWENEVQEPKEHIIKKHKDLEELYARGGCEVYVDLADCLDGYTATTVGKSGSSRKSKKPKPKKGVGKKKRKRNSWANSESDSEEEFEPKKPINLVDGNDEEVATPSRRASKRLSSGGKPVSSQPLHFL